MAGLSSVAEQRDCRLRQCRVARDRGSCRSWGTRSWRSRWTSTVTSWLWRCEVRRTAWVVRWARA